MEKLFSYIIRLPFIEIPLYSLPVIWSFYHFPQETFMVSTSYYIFKSLNDETKRREEEGEKIVSLSDGELSDDELEESSEENVDSPNPIKKVDEIEMEQLGENTLSVEGVVQSTVSENLSPDEVKQKLCLQSESNVSEVKSLETENNDDVDDISELSSLGDLSVSTTSSDLPWYSGWFTSKAKQE